MHLICLGVVRKLLNIWLHGKSAQKLSNAFIINISNLLQSIKRYVPVEFVRKTRSLNDLSSGKRQNSSFFFII